MANPGTNHLHHCELCLEVYLHPSEECETIDAKCSFLIQAGWVPAIVRVFSNGGIRQDGREKYLLTRGGWICPKHV